MAKVRITVKFTTGDEEVFNIEEGGHWSKRDDVLVIKPNEAVGPPRWEIPLVNIQSMLIEQVKNPVRGELWRCMRKFDNIVMILNDSKDSYAVMSSNGNNFRVSRKHLVREATEAETKAYSERVAVRLRREPAMALAMALRDKIGEMPVGKRVVPLFNALGEYVGDDEEEEWDDED